MNKEKTLIILDRCLEFLLYLMIFFIPIAKASIGIIFGFVFTFFLVKKILKPDFNFFKNPAYLFLLLFFAFSALSLFNSGALIKTSLRALFGKWLLRILIFIIIADTLNTRQRLKRAAFVLIGIASLVAMDALFQKFFGKDFFHGRPLVYGFPTAGFENQNSLGVYLAPGLVLMTVLLFLRQTKNKYRVMLFALCGVAAAALFLAFSRSAWLAFIAGLFLFLILSFNMKKALITIFICVAIFISIPSVRNRFMMGDYKDRISLINTSFAMIKNRPYLGQGIGTYMDHFREYATIPGVYYAHNCYLQIWAETGVFSFLSFLLFVGLLFSRGIFALKKRPDSLLLSFACLIGTSLFHIFFDVQLYSLQLATSFWLTLGVLAAAIGVNNAELKA